MIPDQGCHPFYKNVGVYYINCPSVNKVWPSPLLSQRSGNIYRITHLSVQQDKESIFLSMWSSFSFFSRGRSFFVASISTVLSHSWESLHLKLSRSFYTLTSPCWWRVLYHWASVETRAEYWSLRLTREVIWTEASSAHRHFAPSLKALRFKPARNESHYLARS